MGMDRLSLGMDRGGDISSPGFPWACPQGPVETGFSMGIGRENPGGLGIPHCFSWKMARIGADAVETREQRMFGRIRTSFFD